MKNQQDKRLGIYSDHRRPFWLPALSFYILAIAVTIAFFFLVWGILHEGKEDVPWVPAGIGASIILGSAVFLREILLRKARERYLLAQKRLDRNLKKASYQIKNVEKEHKFTIEKNNLIVDEIKRKSEAAKVLNKLPEGHLAVFELCEEYLKITEKELVTVGVGSPRIAAFHQGRKLAKQLHKFHLLSWAEIEVRSLTQKAKNRVIINDKIETAQKALTVLESALRYYPEEQQLIDSELFVNDFIMSVNVANIVEKAEKALYKGNNKRALNYYRDALFALGRGNLQNSERKLIAEEIKLKIEHIQEYEEFEKENKNTSRDENCVSEEEND